MEDRKAIGVGAFVVAGVSFVPLLGVLPGLIAVIWGLVSNRKGAKLVALLGAAGIMVTIALYGSLFYFGFAQRGGVYDGLRTQLAGTQLNQLVPIVETYKLRHGAYPSTLDDLAKDIPANSAVSIFDASGHDPTKPRKFFYEPAGEGHYYLRGVGEDGQPFTADDILPDVTGGLDGLGLLIERQPAIAPKAPDA